MRDLDRVRVGLALDRGRGLSDGVGDIVDRHRHRCRSRHASDLSRCGGPIRGGVDLVPDGGGGVRGPGFELGGPVGLSFGGDGQRLDRDGDRRPDRRWGSGPGAWIPRPSAGERYEATNRSLAVLSSATVKSQPPRMKWAASIRGLGFDGPSGWPPAPTSSTISSTFRSLSQSPFSGPVPSHAAANSCSCRALKVSTTLPSTTSTENWRTRRLVPTTIPRSCDSARSREFQ